MSNTCNTCTANPCFLQLRSRYAPTTAGCLLRCFNIIFFFFFQAEDGIRDYKVTGVHVCSSDLESNRRRVFLPFAWRQYEHCYYSQYNSARFFASHIYHPNGRLPKSPNSWAWWNEGRGLLCEIGRGSWREGWLMWVVAGSVEKKS